MISRSCI